MQSSETNKDAELNKLRGIIDRCGVIITDKKSTEFGIKDVEQDLARLLKDDASVGTLPQADMKIAMGAASALIRYLGVSISPIKPKSYPCINADNEVVNE